jgi:hypothetical protein
MLTIPRIAEVRLEHRAYFLQAAASGHVVAGSPEGHLSVLSPELTLLGRFDLARHPSDVAISPAGDRLAICAGDTLSLVRSGDGAETLRVTLGACCAVRFSDDGTLLWTLHPEADDTIAVQLRDAGDGRLLREGRFAVPTSDVRCSFHPHPHRDHVSLWVAAGQDGQWIFWAHDAGASITVVQAEPESIAECTPPVFDATGGAFLISAFETLSRWSLAEHARSATIDEWPWSESEDDCVGESIAWVGPHRAIVATNENRLYLVDLVNARVIDEAFIEGHPVLPIGEIHPALAAEPGLSTDLVFFLPVGTSRLLSVHGDLEASSLVLSDASPLQRST